MSLIPFYLVHLAVKGENPTEAISFTEEKENKSLTLACIHTFTDQFLSNFI